MVGRLVKVLKLVAMSLSTSIWVMRVWEMRPISSSALGRRSAMAFCRYCKLSFMGVSGFLISWATWRAISRQAASFFLGGQLQLARFELAQHGVVLAHQQPNFVVRRVVVEQLVFAGEGGARQALGQQFERGP